MLKKKAMLGAVLTAAIGIGDVVLAKSAVNIVGQSLATNDDVGLLFIDVPIASTDPKATQLRNAIDGLDTSVRT